ncbi:MAG: CBS domain-containing protein [Bacteroidota bacterium]
MNLQVPIAEWMTAAPVTVAPDDRLLKAKEHFSSYPIHHLPVVEDGRLVGMLSKTDLLYFLQPPTPKRDKAYPNLQQLKMVMVRDAMRKRVRTVAPTDPVLRAVELFAENLFHALPVVDAEGKVAGIITTHDVIWKLLPKQDSETFSDDEIGYSASGRRRI